MKARIYLIATFCLCFLVASGQKSLLLEDRVYEPQIKTVRCYPLEPVDGNLLLPAITQLESQNLVIEFDDLREERNNYYVKLIHCNHDWSKSGLMDLDFMRDYNEFLINDYSFSINTYIPYVHYRFAIPQVKLPGNYLVMVYRESNREDLILTRRISVFTSKVSFAQDDNLAGLGNIRNTNQALNFVVNYGNLEILNPLGNVHVTIRQNQRWDNAKLDVKPSFSREDIHQLEYRFFDMDQTFSAGNEFRFVDFRSLNYPGQNTMRLDKSKRPWELYVANDAVRTSQAYAQYEDLNGNFYVDNADYRQEPWISANYLWVNFNLNSPQLQGDVYVLGSFNNWNKNEENKLKFGQGAYTARILLKQGFYNYQYWVDATRGDANQVEGNHFQTENVYEVLVYYRPFQPNADMLIGYFVIPVNPR